MWRWKKKSNFTKIFTSILIRFLLIDELPNRWRFMSPRNGITWYKIYAKKTSTYYETTKSKNIYLGEKC